MCYSGIALFKETDDIAKISLCFVFSCVESIYIYIYICIYSIYIYIKYIYICGYVYIYYIYMYVSYIYMLSKCALPFITTMALWQLMHLGT